MKEMFRNNIQMKNTLLLRCWTSLFDKICKRFKCWYSNYLWKKEGW